MDFITTTKPLTLITLIGSGNERDCYIHPDNPSYCVKVTKPGVIGRRQNEIDMAYFKLLTQRNIVSPHIPVCHGWVETNFGRGIIVDRICRTDFSPAPSVLTAVKTNLITAPEAFQLIDEVFIYAIKNNIVVTDCNLDHLILSEQTDSSFKIAIVDGLGARFMGIKFWIRTLIGTYGRLKTRKVWLKCIATLQAELQK